MALVFANIGSNIGNRKQLISKALERISKQFGICCISDFIESEPWGFESGNRFLNLGVSFHSNLHPEEILTRLLEIEKSICADSHRDDSGRYKDRRIDIDIMAIDETCYKSERLTLPHTHLRERDFFLIPLLQLCPQWKHPLKEQNR